MKLRLIGQANHTGIGTHFDGFVRALRDQRPHLPVVLVDPYDILSIQAAIADSDDQDINICWTAHLISGLRGRMIQWVPFETTRIPNYIAGALNAADEIWTMTNWGAQVLEKDGYRNVSVVPQGVDRYPMANADDTGVLRVLMVAKYEQRKGIQESLEAWSQSLINDPGYRLVIKTHATNDDTSYQQLGQTIRELGIENYEWFWGVMPEQDLVKLYQSCHVLLAPAYAEGWGRPIMEAAAVGLPVISTQWSAHGEWLECIRDSVRWVDYDLVPVNDRDYEMAYGHQADWGVWARPRASSIAEQLRYAANHWPALAQRARTNREIILDRFSWERVVNLATARLGLA